MVIKLEAGHQFSQAMPVHFPGGPGTNLAAITDHRHTVGDFEYFIQTMADKNDADVLFFQVTYGAQKLVHFGTGQRCGRLIHNHQTRICHQRTADRYLLSLGNRQPCQSGIKLQIKLQFADDAFCACTQLFALYQPNRLPRFCSNAMFSATLRLGNNDRS